MKNKMPVIILGAGRHTIVLLDTLFEQGTEIVGILDPDKNKLGTKILGVPVIGDDPDIVRFSPDEVELVNGVGSIGSTALRRKIFERFKKQGYKFRTVIHSNSIISKRAKLGEGVQVMAGAIIYAETFINDDSIVNTRANISCESHIGRHVHIAPGTIISGGVTIDDGTHVGTGSVVIQGVHIGENSILGAGTVVLKDLPANGIYVGNPARVVIK